jgi:hypothetical protein
MAINDILAQVGDAQDFIVEIPAGNASYTPEDVLLKSNGAILCADDQIKTVANELVEASRHMYEVFGMELSFRLSFRDDTSNSYDEIFY